MRKLEMSSIIELEKQIVDSKALLALGAAIPAPIVKATEALITACEAKIKELRERTIVLNDGTKVMVGDKVYMFTLPTLDNDGFSTHLRISHHTVTDLKKDAANQKQGYVYFDAREKKHQRLTGYLSSAVYGSVESAKGEAFLQLSNKLEEMATSFKMYENLVNETENEEPIHVDCTGDGVKVLADATQA
jgi:hypothetical protein